MRDWHGTWVEEQGTALRRLPIEAVPAAFFAFLAVYAEGPGRWGDAALALAFTLLLLRSDTGIRLLAAVITTAFFATAMFWEDIGGWRLAFVGAAVVSMGVARWVGAIVWPDVAIFFVVCLAAVAVRDARDEQPEPAPQPVMAVLELPDDRIRPPTNELKAPSKVEIVALTPGRVTPAGVVAHEATRFEGLLLTPVKRSGATGRVSVLIDRGDDGAAARELARASLDATELVLLPAGECFVSPRQLGLTHPRAMTVLLAHGLSEAEAKSFVDSFAGPIDFVPVLPGARFNRYFSGRSTVGRFLTRSDFQTSAAARGGLDLPETNQAELVQTVRVVAPAMALLGRIKNGLRTARQFVVLRTACFDYGRGRPVEPQAP